MQLTAPKIHVIERLVNTPKGLFLARFAVIEIGGTYKARLIEMIPAPSDAALVHDSSVIFLLETPLKKEIPASHFIGPTKPTSPYFDLSTFFVSQPTRAPAF